MVMTAVDSLTFNTGAPATNHGVFSGDVSPIHLLALVVLVTVPQPVLAARRHDIAAPAAAGSARSSSAQS